jgi:hypothetical protein
MALLAALACGACSRAGMEEPACRKDSDCDPGSACNVGRCIAKLTDRQTWAVEVLPKSDSKWALTELPTLTFAPERVAIRVERKVTVEGEISGVEDTQMSSNATTTLGVLLTVPSGIGARERQFEGQAGRRGASGGSIQLTVVVPESLLGREAKIRIVPASPIDRVLAPWTVTVPSLAAMLALAAPKSTEVTLVEGTLRAAFDDDVPPPYVARALMAGRLVSNVERTDEQGRFKLRIPTDGVKIEETTVELAPVDASTGSPRLIAKPVAGKPLVVRLPTAPQLQSMEIPVTAMGDRADAKIPGVTLIFYAPLAGAWGADAVFRREFQTDKDGRARVSLVPGNAGETRDYAVAVIPPPNSKYAARCLTNYAVASAPGGTTRVGASIELAPKLAVAGQVVDGSGAPQNGVMVTAVRKGSAYVKECETEVTSPPSTATTGADGRYQLLLDAGAYRLEYEPPFSGPGTPLLEDDVVVGQSQTGRKVTMPAGVLAEGVISTPDNTAAAGCEVRAYAPGRDGKTLELRARALSGEDGSFRIVLPRAP